eukprot:CAMPEP_0171965702 /NCGR_PEP_ID=MMETSP0993-20121228/188834_1 /TAXON_ID=483369 /ORGANISM="non described non described, Strain CCMP2098" /LENGTH=56 /DNA_ID=CAMNT_0012614821 /DNA_START=91 /DNA_END=258 /DNA_ORIENTATION=-
MPSADNSTLASTGEMPGGASKKNNSKKKSTKRWGTFKMPKMRGGGPTSFQVSPPAV